MKRYRLDPKNPPRLSKTDLARLDRMKDEDIDYSEIPPLDEEFFTKATVAPPSRMSSEERFNAMMVIAKRAAQLPVFDPRSPDEIIGYRTESDAMGDDDLPMPPLFGEDYISAQVLDIVSRYCDAGGNQLDSYGVPAYAELMRMCAEVGHIELTGEFGDRITGSLTPEGRATLRQYDAERESKSGEPPPRIADPDYTGWSHADLEAAWNEALDRLGAIIQERTDAHDLDMRHIRLVREIACISQAMHRLRRDKDGNEP